MPGTRKSSRLRSAPAEDKNDAEVVVSPPKKAKAAPKAAPKTKAPAKKSATAKAAPKASSKAKGKRSGKRSVADDDNDEDEEEDAKPVMKSIVVKGKAPVDDKCGKAANCHVYVDGDGVVWDAMLNQTNIQNNNNKFYLIQLLESDAGKSYFVWMRWGRVGYDGQNSLTPCGGSLDRAQSVFSAKFSAKTKNEWAEKDSFEKWPGKYDLVHMDYNTDEVDGGGTGDNGVKKEVKEEKAEKKIPESKLEQKVQDLIKLVCDVNTFEQTVRYVDREITAKFDLAGEELYCGTSGNALTVTPDGGQAHGRLRWLHHQRSRRSDGDLHRGIQDPELRSCRYRRQRMPGSLHDFHRLHEAHRRGPRNH